MLRRTITVLLVSALILSLFSGCSEPAPDDPAAKLLAKNFNYYENESTLYPSIKEVENLPASVCIIVEEEKTWFLESKDLPIAPPEEAQAILLLRIQQQLDKKTWSGRMELATPGAEYTVWLREEFTVKSLNALPAIINDRFTFTDEMPFFLDEIKTYEQQLFARDYLFAINNCKGDYGKVQGLQNVTMQQSCDPLVYMTDEEYVATPVGGDLMRTPGESKQYVPPSGNYQRPEIAGTIALGFSKMGKPRVAGETSIYTAAEIQAQMAQESNTFCFIEAIESQEFMSFTSKSSASSEMTYSYVMRISVISMDGELLGWTAVTYPMPAEKDFEMEAQMIAIGLTRDKHNKATFAWDYVLEFWKEFY